MEYKTTAKLVIQSCDKDLPGVFGHGCVLLLQGIAREHSLNRAAKSMGMAYSKAWRIVNEAEGQRPLISRHLGANAARSLLATDIE